jgi:hypothetical protein
MLENYFCKKKKKYPLPTNNRPVIQPFIRSPCRKTQKRIKTPGDEGNTDRDKINQALGE